MEHNDILIRPTIGLHIRLHLTALLVMSLFWLPAATISAKQNSITDDNTSDDKTSTLQTLLFKYKTIKKTLAARQKTNNYHTPLYIYSTVVNNKATGHVYATIPYAFALVTRTFNSAHNWCNAAILHVNVKSCTISSPQGNTLISLYIGDTDYQEPKNVAQIDYLFESLENPGRYLQIKMYAAHGPLDSTDFKFNFEAMPLDETNTFIHFSYSAQYGVFSDLLMQSYLASMGRHKVGFTQNGTDEHGNKTYIKGTEGVIERNAMRYFLALESYLDTTSLPNAQRFEAGLNRWFEFTKQYKPQLYELTREEYFTNKLREHENQEKLQQNIGEQ